MRTTIRPEIVKYKLSCDKVGLLAYFDDDRFYHIHFNELSTLENWIHGILLDVE